MSNSKKRTSKLVALISVCLMLAILLASCGTVGIKDIYKDPEAYEATPVLTKAKITDLTGSIESYIGDLVYLTDDSGEYEVHTVYNLATDTKVATFTDTDTLKHTVGIFASFVEDETYNLYAVKTANSATGTTVYSNGLYLVGNAEPIATSDKEDVSINTVLDLVQFDNKYYRYNDEGALEFVFERGFTAGALPDFDGKAGDYYYIGDFSSSDIAIYDNEANLTAFWEFPDWASDTSGIFPLENGDVLVQYAVELPETEKDYTFLDGNVKYQLYTEIIDAKSGKVSDVKLDAVLEAVINRSDFNRVLDVEISKSIKNIGVGYIIEDERIDTNTSATHAFTLSNSGKRGDEVKEYIDGQSKDAMPDWIAADRFVIENLAGEEFLLNEKGKVIGNVSGATQYGTYFAADGKLYDFDLNEKFNYAKENMVIHNESTSKGAFLVKSDGKTFYYSGGTKNEIISDSSIRTLLTVSDQLFVILETTLDPDAGAKTSYLYYNADGTLLHTFQEINASLETSADDGKALLYSHYDSVTNKTIYIRFAA